MIAGVHVGCSECERIIHKLFPKARVTFTGKGPQKDVKIAAKGLNVHGVLQDLQGAGFHGQPVR